MFYPVLRKCINDNTLNNILTKAVPVGPLGKFTYAYLYIPRFSGPVHHRQEQQKVKNITRNSPEMKRSRGVCSPGAQEGYLTPSGREDIDF